MLRKDFWRSEKQRKNWKEKIFRFRKKHFCSSFINLMSAERVTRKGFNWFRLSIQLKVLNLNFNLDLWETRMVAWIEKTLFPYHQYFQTTHIFFIPLATLEFLSRLNIYTLCTLRSGHKKSQGKRFYMEQNLKLLLAPSGVENVLLFRFSSRNLGCEMKTLGSSFRKQFVT